MRSAPWPTLGSICAALLAATASLAQQSRPAITGISHISLYTANPAASEHFYTFVLGASKGADPQDSRGVRYYLSPTQFVEVLPLPAQHGLSRMDRVAYNTADAAGLRAYLIAHGVSSAGEVKSGSDNSHWFMVKDPEGNTSTLR